MKPTVMRANPDEDNYLLESRVRENRMHGSEGGESESSSRPLSVQKQTIQNYIVSFKTRLDARSHKAPLI